jgi:hypothetical protein
MKNKLFITISIILTLALSYVCADYLQYRKEVRIVAGGQSYPETHYNIRQSYPVQEVESLIARITGEKKAITTDAPLMATTNDCMYWASRTYGVPMNVLTGIRTVEGGHVGQSVANINGTRDLGIMQINSLWVPQLAQIWHVDYATAYRAVRDSGCENVYIGAWILKQKVAQTGTLYNGIAYYHSATPYYGKPYANKVVMVMARNRYVSPPPLMMSR